MLKILGSKILKHASQAKQVEMISFLSSYICPKTFQDFVIGRIWRVSLIFGMEKDMSEIWKLRLPLLMRYTEACQDSTIIYENVDKESKGFIFIDGNNLE